MISVEEAQSKILATISPLPTEMVPLSEADERVVAAELASLVNLPAFDNSAMDGYAVHSADLAAAAKATPARLRIAGIIPAGQAAATPLPPGSCHRIFTGSKMPAGADAVVMQEDTLAADDGKFVDVFDSVKPWENVRFRGEDVGQNAIVAHAGQRLRPALLGLLAAAGHAQIPAFRKPRIAVIATGSELREPGTELKPGEIYESNRPMLSALIRSACAASPVSCPVVPDDLAATQAALQEAFEQCDAVVTSGGASVGSLDYVKEAFSNIGGEVEFWKISMKPGKPFLFGRWNGKPLFGLPGNPVSSFVTFLLMARPALLRMQGIADVALPAQPAALRQSIANRGNRRLFLRARIEDNEVFSAGGQASHFLSSLAACNGLVDVPPESTLEKGELVNVLRWEW